MSDLYLLTITIKLIYFDHSIVWKHSSTRVLDLGKLRSDQIPDFHWLRWVPARQRKGYRRMEWS